MSSVRTDAEPTNWPSVLIVHNKYQRRGGEETVVEAEVDLLRSAGVHVETMIYHSLNDAKIRRLKKRPDQLVFNHNTYDEARNVIQRHGIQVVHCHNLFPLLSTSIYSAAAAEKVPLIQTVHNYRMGCLNALHLRNGKICELCRPGYHVPGVVFGCYRGSRSQSLVFGVTQTVNGWRGAWHQPTLYITPCRYVQEKLISWCIPANNIVVKPHFISYDPGKRSSEGHHALFVGRLSSEKGLDLLLDVWGPDRLPLVIVGDGPLRAHLEQRVQTEHKSNVRFAGYQDQDGVHTFLQDARFLVMPSTWHETFGLVLIEAYAHSIPVIATRLGAMADIVQDGITGLLFGVNNRADLAAKLTELHIDPAKTTAMGRAARQAYETLYSTQVNAEQLRKIYAKAMTAGTPLRSI